MSLRSNRRSSKMVVRVSRLAQNQKLPPLDDVGRVSDNQFDTTYHTLFTAVRESSVGKYCHLLQPKTMSIREMIAAPAIILRFSLIFVQNQSHCRSVGGYWNRFWNGFAQFVQSLVNNNESILTVSSIRKNILKHMNNLTKKHES